MLTLTLMRHAKSSWADPRQDDFDRPLNGRGRRAAPLIGDWLAARGVLPDAALVSAAARTRETWACLGPAFADIPASFRAELYHSGADMMLRVLRAATSPRVLMLGHQPGIGDMAARLLAAPPDDPSFDRYPTAAAAVIAFDAPDWTAVAWGSGRLDAFATPAALSVHADED